MYGIKVESKEVPICNNNRSKVVEGYTHCGSKHIRNCIYNGSEDMGIGLILGLKRWRTILILGLKR